MKHLLIIGARGFGREVYSTFLTTTAYRCGEVVMRGFLDDKADALDAYPGPWPPIVGSVEDYEPQADDVFFCALGDAHWRHHYASIIERRGGRFMSIISPGSYLSPQAEVGEGCYISPMTSISPNVRLGRHVVVHTFATLGHDAVVGDCSTLEAYVFMGGGARVGSLATMHTRSTVLPHKVVADEAVVGVGSVVMRNVAAGAHVFGNPAKRIEM